MLHIGEFGDRTAGRPVIEHPHTPELIMHWTDVCTDPSGHRVAGDSTIAANPVTHRDQLVAEWIEADAIHVFGAMCDEIGPGCIVPQAPQDTGLPPTAS
jgi:hypothetical protein